MQHSRYSFPIIVDDDIIFCVLYMSHYHLGINYSARVCVYHHETFEKEHQQKIWNCGAAEYERATLVVLLAVDVYRVCWFPHGFGFDDVSWVKIHSQN